MKAYTPAEAAKKLNVHPETLRQWESKGKLPFDVIKKPSGQRKYPMAQVDHWKEQLKGGAIPEDLQTAEVDLEKARLSAFDAFEKKLTETLLVAQEIYPDIAALGFMDPHLGECVDGGALWFPSYGFCVVSATRPVKTTDDFRFHDGFDVEKKYPELKKIYDNNIRSLSTQVNQAIQEKAGEGYDALITAQGLILFDFYGYCRYGENNPTKEVFENVLFDPENCIWAKKAAERDMTIDQWLCLCRSYLPPRVADFDKDPMNDDSAVGVFRDTGPGEGTLIRFG